MPNQINIHGAVEGDLDEAILRRLAQEFGYNVTAVLGKKGKDFLRQHIQIFNRAAFELFWFVLIDFDSEADCVPSILDNYLPTKGPKMCLRFAVNEIEAWLLADQEALAGALKIPTNKIPYYPDSLKDPKKALIDLARFSKRKEIRQDLIPRPGTTNHEGPGYTLRMTDYIYNHWRPRIASRNSDSLHRCLLALERLSP